MRRHQRPRWPVPRAESVGQISFIYESAARSVNKKGVGPHSAQHLAIDHLLSVFCQWAMQAHDVGRGEQLLRTATEPTVSGTLAAGRPLASTFIPNAAPIFATCCAMRP